MDKKNCFFLCGILLLSLILHAWRIQTPKSAVFDEVHFATYATNYVAHIPFFDIHPPLGKFIFSLPLYFFSKQSLAESPFIQLVHNTRIEYKILGRSFSNFPYIPLRAVSALFGVLLVFSTFLFVRELTKNNTAAFLSAFFITLENSLLIETRFILLDGMFLSFSFFALWQFLKQKDSGIYSGILWGCALATKLIGIIFLPFILFQKESWWKKYKFITIGFFILGTLWVGIQWFSFSTSDWYTFTKSVNTDLAQTIPQIPKNLSITENITLKSYLLLNEVAWSTEGYTIIKDNNFGKSRWYGWPFMIGSFCYSNTTTPICLIGNPALWALGLLAIIWTILYLIIKKMRKEKPDQKAKSLLIGYFCVLFPFAIVPRFMLIYHYFPALIFSLCLAAYWIITYSETLEKNYRIFFYAIVVFVVCVGFLAVSPTTFGIR